MSRKRIEGGRKVAAKKSVTKVVSGAPAQGIVVGKRGRRPVKMDSRVEMPPPGEWLEGFRRLLEVFNRMRSQKLRPILSAGRRAMPSVFLQCEITHDIIRVTPDGKPIPALLKPITISVFVRNSGNHPSSTCYVQILEGRTGEPFSAYKVRAEQIISVQPEEIRTIRIKAARERTDTGFMSLCFDPIYFPFNAAVELFGKPVEPPIIPRKPGIKIPGKK